MRNRIKGIVILGALLIFTYIVFKILQPERFGSPSSLGILFQQSMLPAVAACGMYFIIIMGMFDFSLGANIVLSAIVGCLLSSKFGIPGLVVGGIAVGTIIGTINGFLYNKLRIPSIIVTVGLCILYECAGLLVSNESTVSLDKQLRTLGKLPYNIIFCLLACSLAYVILTYTKIGTYCKAIGANETMAHNMGVNIKKYKAMGFVLCGLFAGILSVVTISYGSSIRPASEMSSMSRNFSPIMGCFIGMALKKYINPVIAIIVGEFLIALINNGLLTNSIDATLQDVIVGLTLIVIVCITSSGKKEDVVK